MTTSEQIIEVLNALCDKFGIVINWTQENVVTQLKYLIQKFILYEISTSAFWIGFMIALSAVLWYATVVLYRKTVKGGYELSDDELFPNLTIVCLVISCFVSAISIIVVGCQIDDIVTASVFPEKTVFDYISDMISYA